jgi:hypothetical protein
MRLKRFLAGLSLALVNSAATAAQIAPGPSNVARSRPFWDQAFAAIFFSLLAVGLVIGGFKLLELATRFDVRREICENGNVAAAIFATGLALGICAVIAAVLLS